MILFFLLLTIFSGGLFVMDIVFAALAGWLFYQAYQQSKSGSLIGTGNPGDPIRDGGGNMPIYQLVKFWLGVAVIVFWVISIFVRISDL